MHPHRLCLPPAFEAWMLDRVHVHGKARRPRDPEIEFASPEFGEGRPAAG